MIIVAPVGRLAEYESTMPLPVNIIPNTAAINIIVAGLLLKRNAIAAGRVKSAITNIMPTI